jgi:hypothetical protein
MVIVWRWLRIEVGQGLGERLLGKEGRVDSPEEKEEKVEK